jgi:hypothetical protein
MVKSPFDKGEHMTDWYTDLRHPSAQKRIEAVRALVKADHPHALDLLRDAYRQETDPDVKEIIKRAGNYLRASSTGSASVPPKQAKAPAASRSSSVNIYDVTWRQARSRIFLFGGSMFAIMFILWTVAGVYGFLDAEVLASFEETVENPVGTSLLLTLCFGLFGGVAFTVLFTPIWMLYHYFIHLFVTRVFKGQNEYQAIIYYLFPRWILLYAFGIGIVLVWFLVSPDAFLSGGNTLISLVISPLVMIGISIWLGRKIGDIYHVGLWRGITSFVAVSVLINLVNFVLN